LKRIRVHDYEERENWIEEFDGEEEGEGKLREEKLIEKSCCSVENSEGPPGTRLSKLRFPAGTTFVIVDYKDFVIIAEEVVPSLKIWDNFFWEWCRGRKPWTFSSGIDPFVARAGVNLLLQEYWKLRKNMRVEGKKYEYESDRESDRKSDRGENMKADKTIMGEEQESRKLILIDACCGSGTMTAVAAKGGSGPGHVGSFSTIYTCDIRPEFLKRATENLEFMGIESRSSSGSGSSIGNDSIFKWVEKDWINGEDSGRVITDWRGIDEDSEEGVVGNLNGAEGEKQTEKEKEKKETVPGKVGVPVEMPDKLPDASFRVELQRLNNYTPTNGVDAEEVDSSLTAEQEVGSSLTLNGNSSRNTGDTINDVLVIANTPWGHRFGGKEDAAAVMQGILDFIADAVKPATNSPFRRGRNSAEPILLFGFYIPHHCLALAKERLDVLVHTSLGKPACFIVGRLKEQRA
jgi:hypothetical protein